MKKVIVGVMSLLVMAACSQSEVVDVNRNNDVIEFGAIAKSPTRAETVYSNTNMPESFTVWATFDGKILIDGDVIVRQQDNSWVNTTTTRYWPAGCSDTKKVTFYAYANDQESFEGTYPNYGANFSNFTVNPDVTQQKDFLVATAYASSGPVQLEFKHALYQLAYSAKCTNENLRVVIDGVTICNVEDTNSGLLSYVEQDNFVGAYLSWERPHVGDNDFSVEFDPVTLDSSNVGVAQTLTIPNSENALLLVPFNSQNKGTWKPATEPLADTPHAYFLVKCAIANVADGDEIMLWGTKKQDGTYETKEIAIPIPGEHLAGFDSGRQFVYTFVFGQGNGGYDPASNEPVLAPVDWSVSVKDFENESDYNKDINMKY
ncbi:MAG: fimbrillin family protein [Alistipes sp.]|nr:fimbrillin family protein [Alistipes sp.]